MALVGTFLEEKREEWSPESVFVSTTCCKLVYFRAGHCRRKNECTSPDFHNFSNLRFCYTRVSIGASDYLIACLAGFSLPFPYPVAV